jgi:hypothetical protein
MDFEVSRPRYIDYALFDRMSATNNLSATLQLPLTPQHDRHTYKASRYANLNPRNTAALKQYKSRVRHEILPKQPSKIRKNQLIGNYSLTIDFSGRYIQMLFCCDPSPSDTFANRITLPLFLQNIMNRTKITTNTLVTSFFYLYRLKQFHPRCQGSQGSGHRLFMAATILASKYMCDDTFDNTAWATVSSGIFKLDEINSMEKEFLEILNFNLFIRSEEWLQFYESLYITMTQKTDVI